MPLTRSSRLWLAGLAASAAFGLALLLAPSEREHSLVSAALQRTATSDVPAPPIAIDPAWGKLSTIEQRTLEPLKSIWSTLTAAQQDKWRLVVDRFQAKPRHVQRRLAARIAEWARLTPEQRARARVKFLELAKPEGQAHRGARHHRRYFAEGRAASLCAGIARRHHGAAFSTIRSAVA
jgi:hypothetical protein